MSVQMLFGVFYGFGISEPAKYKCKTLFVRTVQRSVLSYIYLYEASEKRAKKK